MAGFSEDTRVKIPALTHLTRIGYTYRPLHSLHLDPGTNIDTETFGRKLHELNPDLSDKEIELFIGKIRVMLNNEDLGREFYEKILSNKTYNIIDYDNPKNNTWECDTRGKVPFVTLEVDYTELVRVEPKPTHI